MFNQPTEWPTVLVIVRPRKWLLWWARKMSPAFRIIRDYSELEMWTKVLLWRFKEDQINKAIAIIDGL